MAASMSNWGLNVFLIDGYGKPYRVSATEGGTWSWAGALPNPQNLGFDRVAAGVDNGNTYAIVGQGPYGNVYDIGQGSAGFFWNGVLPTQGNTFEHYATFTFNGPQLVGTSPPTGSLWPNSLHRISGPWAWDGALPYSYNGPFGAVNTVPCILCANLGTHMNVVAISQNIYAQGMPCFWAQKQGSRTWIPYGTQNNCVPNNEGAKFTDMTTGVTNGYPQVILLTGDGRLYNYTEDRAYSSWFGNGFLPPTPGYSFTKLAAGPAHSDLQLVVLGTDGKPYSFTQSHSDYNWNWNGPLPNPQNLQFSAVIANVGANSNLYVILLGTDGLVYLLIQSNSTGAWTWYGRLPTA